MSLNGLDEAAVVEAHQAALAETGGWLLVKYVNRDTVTLLSQGTGGVVEARLAVEQYDEKSPLYGLLQYRRRKIVLKYVPEGTSRLLQVRLSVQFQSILETFIPHDTVFSFTHSAELTESALSSNSMYGTRAGSMQSSSSSLRRGRLVEITEDVEEVGSSHARAVAAAPAAQAVDEKINQLSQMVDPDFSDMLLPLEDNRAPSPSNRENPDPAPPPSGALLFSGSSGIPPSSQNLPASPLATSIQSRQEDLRPSSQQLTEAWVLSNHDLGLRPVPLENSSVYKRESGADSDTASQYSARPKKKFGPRPHLDSQGRPTTSASTRGSNAPRPVANLPNSVQLSHRSGSAPVVRPDSRQSSRSVSARIVQYSAPVLSPVLPSSTNNAHIASLYVPQQSHPTNSRPFSAIPLTSNATPEKLRLMKALQMRKKNMMSAQRASLPSQVPIEAWESPRSTSLNLKNNQQVSAKPQIADRTSPNNHNSPFITSLDQLSSAVSPLSTSQLSEKPSTKSSFTEGQDRTNSCGSISSDTGSSVTPKANPNDVRRRSLKSIEDETIHSTSSLLRSEGQNRPRRISSPTVESGAETLNHPTRLTKHDSNNAKEPKTSPRDLEFAKTLAALNNEQYVEANKPVQVGEMNLSRIEVQKETSQVERDRTDTLNAATTEPKRTSIETPAPQRYNKGRGILDPLRTVSSPEASELSDDESFMDELQHAKVEQAKPIIVARSPATPIFSRASSDRLKELPRAVSTPIQGATRSPGSPDRPKTGSNRSVSSNLPQWPPASTGNAPVQLAKKGTLSSGISNRIKALEVFSSRETSTSLPVSPPKSEKPRLTMPSFRKRASFLPHQETPNTSISTPPPKEFPTTAAVSTPVHEASSPRGGRPWVQRQGSNTEINVPTQKGESISVTARIIRDKKGTPGIMDADPAEPMAISLHRSPLLVEHGKLESQAPQPIPTKDVSYQSLESPAKSPRSERRRFSFTSNRSNSHARLATSDSIVSRTSMTSSHKDSRPALPNSASEHSSIAEAKKESRASRLVKRMSNLSASSRRSFVGALSSKDKNRPVATIAEQTERTPRTSSDSGSMTHVVDIGDLNVQFPDTLLWKRRFVRIDDHGDVIFSPPTMERNTRGISRSFHLSDFRKPTLPDIDQQELSWSIRLELDDGSCLQCACESRKVQADVLNTLVNAHTAYHQLYSD